MMPVIYVNTRSSGRVEFLDIGRMFKFIDENLNDVIDGYVGV